MNFIELCDEVGVWSTRNFGDQTPDNPLLGVLEEIGEISHSYLKSLQGIRGSEAQHIEAMRDGVGDAMVFLADFCYRADVVKEFPRRAYLNLPFDQMPFNLKNYAKGVEKHGPRFFLFQAARTVSDIYNYYLMRDSIPFGTIRVEQLLDSLNGFCHLIHFNFAECMMTTWGIVKQRDWTKNKETGVA